MLKPSLIVMSEMIKEHLDNPKANEGFKKTKIGLIPDDWDVVSLGNIGKIISGLTYSPNDINENGILVLRSSNVQNRQLEFNDNVYVNVDEDDFNPVIENDILICVRNGSRSLIGKNTLINKESEGYAFGAFMTVYRSKLNKFLFHLFDTDIYNKEVHRNLGATINSINGSDLKKFIMPLPPENERLKIASILSDWDEAIENTQTLIEKLQLRKKGLMQQLLTGKTRLAGFNEEWKEYKFGDVTTKFSKRNKELINARVYSVTNDRGFILQTEMFEREVAGDDLTGYKIIKKNEFAYNPARVNVGSIALFKDEIGIISSLYVCFKTNEKLLNDYLINLLETDELKHRINRYGEGGVRIYLWYYLFEAIKIKLPSVVEQKAILEILDAADQEIEHQQNYLKQLQAQKKGLMQQLLTGKIRVKV